MFVRTNWYNPKTWMEFQKSSKGRNLKITETERSYKQVKWMEELM
jgi:hypothetical protein